MTTSPAIRARRSQRTGADFELVVVGRLRALGAACVEKVATPMIKVRGTWVPGRKVSCDIKGILRPSGRAVHVECKLRPGRSLVWSDLRPHQHDHLQECLDAGGLALIAFSDTQHGVVLLSYEALRQDHHWRPGARLSADAMLDASQAAMGALRRAV